MQDRSSALHLSWPSLRYEAKFPIGPGWGGGKIWKEASFMEDSLYLKRVKIDSNEEHTL